MADTPPPAAATKSTPKTVKMPRALHELVTGSKPENKIEAGTLLTDDITKEHKLTEKDVNALTDTGAIDHVDVLKG